MLPSCYAGTQWGGTLELPLLSQPPHNPLKTPSTQPPECPTARRKESDIYNAGATCGRLAATIN